MKKIIFALFLSTFALAFVAQPVLAVNPQEAFRDSVKKAKLVPEKGEFPSLATATGAVLQSLLAFIGTLVLIVVIYAGFLWATALGNEEKVKKAKGMLVGGIIGLTIIITSAYLVGFVVDLLANSISPKRG